VNNWAVFNFEVALKPWEGKAWRVIDSGLNGLWLSGFRWATTPRSRGHLQWGVQRLLQALTAWRDRPEGTQVLVAERDITQEANPENVRSMK
jgi:hypothetical protein